jgi:hypothetical protein
MPAVGELCPEDRYRRWSRPGAVKIWGSSGGRARRTRMKWAHGFSVIPVRLSPQHRLLAPTSAISATQPRSGARTSRSSSRGTRKNSMLMGRGSLVNLASEPKRIGRMSEQKRPFRQNAPDLGTKSKQHGGPVTGHPSPAHPATRLHAFSRSSMWHASSESFCFAILYDFWDQDIENRLFLADTI